MGNLRTRVRLPKKTVDVWKPTWSPEIRGWARNYIVQNRWRCEQVHGIDDLMQDAYVVFLKVCDAYPRVVEPQHFMSLFKTSLRNMLFDKAREYERKLHLVDESCSPDDEDFNIDRVPEKVLNEGMLNALLENGPPELRLLYRSMQDDTFLARLREPQREKRGQPRLNIDQRLSSLLGIGRYHFRDALKQLLTT